MGKARRLKLERRAQHLTDGLPISTVLTIYRYLEEESHVAAWTTGGRIPIRQALYYRNLEGEGGRADSEDAMHRTVTGMRLDQIQNSGKGRSPFMIGPGVNIRMEFNDCVFAEPCGVYHIKEGKLSQHHPPCLILCLSTTLSAKTAKAIDAKCKFCVRIRDIDRLREVIDKKLDAKGRSQRVQYTTGDDRHTFLKSIAYRDQAEYRLAWEGVVTENVWVELPEGIAERVEIPD